MQYRTRVSDDDLLIVSTQWRVFLAALRVGPCVYEELVKAVAYASSVIDDALNVRKLRMKEHTDLLAELVKAHAMVRTYVDELLVVRAV